MLRGDGRLALSASHLGRTPRVEPWEPTLMRCRPKLHKFCDYSTHHNCQDCTYHNPTTTSSIASLSPVTTTMIDNHHKPISKMHRMPKSRANCKTMTIAEFNRNYNEVERFINENELSPPKTPIGGEGRKVQGQRSDEKLALKM